jgi:hypothetical protein
MKTPTKMTWNKQNLLPKILYNSGYSNNPHLRETQDKIKFSQLVSPTGTQDSHKNN